MGGVIEPPLVHLSPTDASVGVGSNQSTTFTATISNGQLATITFYYDGALQPNPTYGSSASFSTPAGDSATAGNYVVQAVASNANGSSVASAYWHIVPCSPPGAYVDFTAEQYRCCPGNDWEDAMCHKNAILRVVWGNLNSGLADKLSQCQWRSRDFCSSQSYTPPQEYGKNLYLVSIVGKDANGEPWPHAVVAENDGDLQDYDDYQFSQFTNTDIKIGEKDQYSDLVQIPKGYKDPITLQVTKTKVEIWELTNIRVDCETNSIEFKRNIDANEIATFYINENGVVE